MSETLRQTSHNGTLSEGYIVGRTHRIPCLGYRQNGFQQAPIPSLSAAAFFTVGRDISRPRRLDRGASVAPRIHERRPQPPCGATLVARFAGRELSEYPDRTAAGASVYFGRRARTWLARIFREPTSAMH